MRSITLPVILTAEQPEFNQDIILDFTPWTLADVVPQSRRAAIKITGLSLTAFSHADIVFMKFRCYQIHRFGPYSVFSRRHSFYKILLPSNS
jgi:hypothetical protein